MMPFSYDEFWERAARIANASNHSNHLAQQQQACPKVFVYNLSAPLSDMEPVSTLTIDSVFGESAGFGGQVRYTQEFSLARILLFRLMHSRSCRTDDPQKAELFLAPILPKPKTHKKWSTACKLFGEAEVRAALPHLTSHTACRHFFVVSKGHNVAYNCLWWSQPNRSSLFSHALRVAYSFGMPERGGTYNATYPNLFSVPYPSAVHWARPDSRAGRTTRPGSAQGAARSNLMLFVGSSSHGDLPVRRRLEEQCRSYKDERVCRLVSCNARTCNMRSGGMSSFLTLKANVTFCLEPGGDSPFRKSLSDSIAFGCIPVLFSNLTDAVAPWFWGSWKDRARVLVPRDDFISGRIDLRALLSSLPPALLHRLQRTLAHHRRNFQYGFDDEPGDATRILLSGVRDQAARGCAEARRSLRQPRAVPSPKPGLLQHGRPAQAAHKPKVEQHEPSHERLRVRLALG